MSEKRCEVCGAPMLHTNNEMCKNYHLQKESTPEQQQPKEPSAVERFNRAMISGHTISKEADVGISFSAKQLKEHDAAIARKAREDVIESLDDLRKYANGEYKEADLSDNEREMRIHLEYENRIWGIMRSLRTTTPHTEQEQPR